MKKTTADRKVNNVKRRLVSALLLAAVTLTATGPVWESPAETVQAAPSMSELQGRVEYAMKGDLRKQADGFLASWDQVKLLEYISKLDEYRIKQVFEERSYEATKADTRSFDILCWPVSGEYWREEFKSYRMILSDRCEAPGKRGAR
jgi:hypothetical protein